MKKLHKKTLSVREEVFALSRCGCGCACDCVDLCGCRIVPTHQIGLNAQSNVRPSASTRQSSAASTYNIAHNAGSHS